MKAPAAFVGKSSMPFSLHPCLRLLSVLLLPELCHLGSKPISFFQSMKLVMGHGPYVKLVGSFLFTSLAFMVRTETVLFFFFWLLVWCLLWWLFDVCELGPGCVAAHVWARKHFKQSSLFALPVAPGGKLRPVLHLHAGLQERLPKHPAGHHGEFKHRFTVSIETATVWLGVLKPVLFS